MPIGSSKTALAIRLEAPFIHTASNNCRFPLFAQQIEQSNGPKSGFAAQHLPDWPRMNASLFHTLYILLIRHFQQNEQIRIPPVFLPGDWIKGPYRSCYFEENP